MTKACTWILGRLLNRFTQKDKGRAEWLSGPVPLYIYVKFAGDERFTWSYNLQKVGKARSKFPYFFIGMVWE